MRRLVSSLALLFLPLPAGATGLEIYGFGPRGASMGLTGAASSEDASALYYNPAGLAGLNGITLTAGYQDDPGRLTIDGQEIGSRQGRATEVLLGFGLSTFGKKSGLAVGLHVPDSGLFGVRIRPPQEPQFVLVDARRDRMHVMAGFALTPTEKLSLGGGVSLFANTLGDIGLNLIANPSGSIDASLLPTNTLHAGVKAGPFSGTTLGLSYRGEEVSSLSFPTDLHASLANVAGEILIDGETDTYFTPTQLTLGADYSRSAFEATVDLILSRWSRMPDPNGFNLLTVIDRTGNLPPGPPGYGPEDPGFHDTLAPHLGVEWRPPARGPRSLALRAGLAYDPTPAPPPSPGRNLIDSDRETLTAGAGITFREPPVFTGPVAIDLQLGWAHLADRTVIRTDPTDPYGSYTAGGDLFSVGLSATVRLDAAYLR